MSEQEHWQLDGSAPQLYQRYLVPAITTHWAEDLIARSLPSTGETVLDLACGTGVVARAAAGRMSYGRVVGLDLNAGMLDVARSLPSQGAAIEWLEGSALDLPFADRTFDLVLCQLGLQFFPDRGRALREMRRVQSHSGRLALSVYSPIEHTPGAHAFVLALDRVLGAGASRIKRAEHSFRKPDELRSLLADAGFGTIDVQTVTKRITFPSVVDYVRFQLIATPMASLLKDKDSDEHKAVIDAISSQSAAMLDDAARAQGRFCFPQEAYVATARWR